MTELVDRWRGALLGTAGDTDTIAAMAGSLAGAHVGASALPGHLLDRLETRVRLIALADLLGRVAGS